MSKKNKKNKVETTNKNIEETIVMGTIDNKQINEEEIEKTKAFVAQDIKDLETNTDDYEYEYYTPHYFRNAFLLGLCMFLIAAVTTYFLTKESIVTEAQEYYLAQGYILTNDATATEDDIYSGKTAYASSEKLTGKFENIDLSLATATEDDVLKGYTFYNADGLQKGTIKGYSGLTNYGVTTESQTILCRNRYLPEPIFTRVDSNLKPENIKEGVSILGVVGTYKGYDE